MSDAHESSLETRNVIAWNELTAEPWRNGGGVTRQILSRRHSARGEWIPAMEDWDLRLSIADVESAGAFSSFSGMTRILTVIEGGSVTLVVNGEIQELERHRPFEFDGGAETSAQLPHGPIRDLNLIARTGTVDATVHVEPLTLEHPRLVSGGQYCVVLDGRALLTLGTAKPTENEVALERFDTVLGSAKHPSTIVGEGVLALITVTSVV